MHGCGAPAVDHLHSLLMCFFPATSAAPRVPPAPQCWQPVQAHSSCLTLVPLFIDSCFRIEGKVSAALVLSEQSLLRMRICASPWSRSSHLLCTVPSPGQSSPCLPTSVELGLSHLLSLVPQEWPRGDRRSGKRRQVTLGCGNHGRFQKG